MYADEWLGEPGDGEFNERFGLYVNRDFGIVSLLDSYRLVDFDTNFNLQLVAQNGNDS